MPGYLTETSEDEPSDMDKDADSGSSNSESDRRFNRSSGESSWRMSSETDEALAAVTPAQPFAGGSRGGPRGRSWTFTLNNPTCAGEDFVALLQENVRIKYAVFQLEQGEMGTRHFQGFIQFGAPVSLLAVRRDISSRAHWEIARGSAGQNERYCSKEEGRIEGPWRCGTIARPGQRNDLNAVAARVLEGASTRELALEFPKQMIMYGSGIYKMKRAVAPPPLDMPRTNLLFIGPSRTGKTWRATHDQLMPSGEFIPKESVFLKGSDAWFDGYNGEKLIVMDEFQGAAQHIPLASVLQWMDNYRVQVPVKGGMEWSYAETLIFTSNLHPKKWYNWAHRQESYWALCARFAEVWIWTARGAPIQVLASPTEVEDFFNDGIKYGFDTTAPCQTWDPLRR